MERCCLLFDFDGVIGNTLRQFEDAFVAALPERLQGQLAGRDAFLDLFDRNLYDSLSRHGLTAAEAAALPARLRPLVAAALEGARPFPGMVDALNALARRHDVAIVTSSSGPAIAAFCARWGFRAHAGVDGSEAGLAKVAKIGARRARHAGLRCCYVGDTVGDMLEAEEAGAEPYGVAWGWHGGERLARSPARRVFVSPEELAAAF